MAVVGCRFEANVPVGVLVDGVIGVVIFVRVCAVGVCFFGCVSVRVAIDGFVALLVVELLFSVFGGFVATMFFVGRIDAVVSVIFLL